MSDAALLGTPAPAPIAPPVNDWRPHLTDELKADPVVSSWAEKASEKDVSALIKTMAHAQHRMGTAINLPGKDAKPEDVSAFKAKLIEAGMIPKPIADPKDYGIAKPDNLPKGVQWSDELTGKFATTLHKYQVPKEIVGELMALHMEALGGATGAVQFDLEQSMAAIRKEHGEKFDERIEQVKRMIPGLFSEESQDFIERFKLCDDPKFISGLMRVAPTFMQDSSFLESLPVKAGTMTGEEALAEHGKVMTDTTHPHYAGYHRMPQDPKAKAYVDSLYRQAYGYQKEA